MKFRARYVIVLFAFLLFGALTNAQEQTAHPQEQGANAAPQQDQHHQEAKREETAQQPGSHEAVGSELAKASREAAGEEDENAEFKRSPSVQLIARITRLSPKSAYWLSVAVNFAILAALIILFSKSKLPAMFRTRTGEIQRGISEARKASEDANRRLADIQARLERLDSDVAAMKTSAEKEAAVEEERTRQAAEAERKKIVDGAESEIAAAAKMARRELKAYTAELAVSLAEKRIHVDAETDRALVDNFVAQLKEPGAPGEDGL